MIMNILGQNCVPPHSLLRRSPCASALLDQRGACAWSWQHVYAEGRERSAVETLTPSAAGILPQREHSSLALLSVHGTTLILAP